MMQERDLAKGRHNRLGQLPFLPFMHRKRTGEESGSCMQECFRIKQGLNEKQQNNKNLLQLHNSLHLSHVFI